MMFAVRMSCLTVLILTMLGKHTTANTSLITSNEYMGELIDVLSNIGDVLAQHRTSESLDTLAGALTGQQTALKSLIQNQQKTMSEILQDHHNSMEELLGAHKPTPVFCSQDPNATSHEVTGVNEQVEKLAQAAENRAKQIEQLSERFEATKQEIDEQMKQKMEQLQALKGKTRLDLDQLRSTLEAELKTRERHMDEAILKVQKDLEQARQQANEVKSVMNGQITSMQQLVDSVQKSLNKDVMASKSQFLKGLDELEARTKTTDATILEEVKEFYNNVSMKQKTSMNLIKSVEEKAEANYLEIKAQILVANSKLQVTEGELGTMREQLEAKTEAVKALTLKKLEERATVVQESVLQLQQDLTSYRTTTQQTTSALDARVTEVNQDMANALEKMATEVKGTKDICTSQTTQSREQAKQATQNVRNDLGQLEVKTNQLHVELGSRIDNVQKLFESSKKSLRNELEITKDQHGKRLDQIKGETAALASNIKQEVEQLRTKTQETTSQLASRVEKADKGLSSAVTQMKAEVEGAKRSCAEQASQSDSHVQQTANQMQNNLKQHEAKFQQFQREVDDRLAALDKRVDAVGTKTETAVKKAKASFSQELQSFKQSLQSALDQTKQRLGVLEQKASQHEKQSASSLTTVKSRLSTVETMTKNSAGRLQALETQTTGVHTNLQKDIDLAASRISVLQTVIPPVVCPSPFERRGYHCFYVFRGVRDTWQGSRARCQAIGGDLAFAFDAPAMANGMRMLRFPPGDYWVGASRLDGNGTWRWINGARVNMTYAWGSGQPDNRVKEEECTAFHSKKRKYLNDFKCDRRVFFICQYVENIFAKY